MLSWTLKYWVAFTLVMYSLSIISIGIYYRYAMNKGILDIPNSRSSHTMITPRGGGFPLVLLWGMFLSVIIYYFVLPYKTLLIFGPAIIIGYLGYIDDKKSLSALSRLFVQILSAVMVLIALGASQTYLLALTFLPIWAVFLILTVGIVWFTNVFNFMDGMDGIAGIEALFFFGLASYIFWQSGSEALTLLTFGLFALVAGFLTWNWPPAKIFLGDTGSGFLGFLISIFALIASTWYGVSIFVWLIMTGIFWFDASITLVRRLISRENVMLAHCSHAYQRLLQRQFSHRTILLIITAVNSILAWMALMVYQQPELGLTIFSYTLMLLMGLYLIVEYLRPMFKTWHSV